MRLLPAVLIALITSSMAPSQTYTISTFAGGGLISNIPGTSAALYGPQCVAIDKAGNVFFTDLNEVLRWDATTHILSVVAGTGAAGFSGDNGPATSAQLNAPYGVALNSAGNLFIADTNNHRNPNGLERRNHHHRRNGNGWLQRRRRACRERPIACAARHRCGFHGQCVLRG